MKEISKFANVAGTPSGLTNQLDSVGSSQDVIFAEAIMALEPTTVLEEAGIIVVRQTPNPHDQLRFPIVRNTQLTWATIDGRSATGSNLGSEFNTTGLNRVEYRNVRPTVKTASIFLPDEVNLLNKVDFDLYSQIAAVDAKRKKESDALTVLTTEANQTNLYAAGGFTSAGSVVAGSTLDPSDLTSAKRLLATGSDPVKPDFVLMHPIQYEDLNTHADFAPGATSPGAMMRKASFDNDGNLLRFNGMDIYVTELISSHGSTTLTADVTNNLYAAVGHPVIVGKKGWAVGRGEKKGITVYSQDDRIRHGTYKVIDMAYDHTYLVQESMVLIRATDT